VPDYVEPFFGSGAVLLGRPHRPKIETINDLDGFVANAWRAIRSDPDTAAKWADNPVNECDLHARHIWLVGKRETLSARLEADPEYFDPKIAGWWLWGIACWIGGGFCSGSGPWGVVEEDGIKVLGKRDAGQGVKRQLPNLGDAGRGVNRQRPLGEWFGALADRLERVRVCCGGWERICGPSVTTKLGVTGVFFDPPYSDEAGRDMDIYSTDSGTVAHDVRRWCIEHQDDPKLRIALCGYEGEHDLPGWDCVAWKAHGGYGSQGDVRGRANATRERIWFSPHCLDPKRRLF